MNVYSAPMGTGMYGGMGMQYGYNPGLQTSDKGKGKSREADFEAAFAQVAESLSSQARSKSEDDVERLEEVLKDATLEQKEELKAYALLSINGFPKSHIFQRLGRYAEVRATL